MKMVTVTLTIFLIFPVINITKIADFTLKCAIFSAICQALCRSSSEAISCYGLTSFSRRVCFGKVFSDISACNRLHQCDLSHAIRTPVFYA